MIESKIYDGIKQKAKLFLLDVMGKEAYDKFISEGKIEIKSGEYIYELAIDGTVINKTKNQRYCIILDPRIPDMGDIPLYDLIAIKYCWLKYRTKTVETVANKATIGIKRLEATSLIVDTSHIESITATVAWKNSSTSSITFRPAIIIDDTIAVNATEDITIDAGGTGSIIIAVPTLSIGEHSICVHMADDSI